MSRNKMLGRGYGSGPAAVLFGALWLTTATIASGAPPVVHIDAPPGAVTIGKGQWLALAGRASDPATGPLSATQLVWSSDRDGPLGTGPAINVLLSAGTHRVSLTVTGDTGEMAVTTVDVIVGQP